MSLDRYRSRLFARLTMRLYGISHNYAYHVHFTDLDFY